MGTFLIVRLVQAVIVVLLVTIIVFIGIRLLPGDPLLMLYNANDIREFTEEEKAAIRAEAGLDKPLPMQYIHWIGGVLQGDLGQSILLDTSVNDDIFKKLPVTLYLGFLALIIGAVIGVPLGIISAVRRGSWLDSLVTWWQRWL